MNVTDKDIPVAMFRESLDDTPSFPTPPGYSIRPYSPGDEHAWVQIQSAADRYNAISLELFRREFSEDADPLRRRQFFLIDSEEQPVGTATAWFDEDHHGRPFGRVHWVAVRPENHGKGLSKPLLAKMCDTLRDLGHERAYLTTSTVRVPAIGLYLRFGFAPEIRTKEDTRIWKAMEAYLPGLRRGG